jgi:hypothetical protein
LSEKAHRDVMAEILTVLCWPTEAYLSFFALEMIQAGATGMPRAGTLLNELSQATIQQAVPRAEYLYDGVLRRRVREDDAAERAGGKRELVVSKQPGVRAGVPGWAAAAQLGQPPGGVRAPV